MVTAIKNTPLFFYGDPEVTHYLRDVGVIHVSEQLGFVQPYPSHLSQTSHQQLWWQLVPPKYSVTNKPPLLYASLPTLPT